jgi:hypothetical protein
MLIRPLAPPHPREGPMMPQGQSDGFARIAVVL